MAKVEFRPNFKQLNVTGGKAKFILEIDKDKIASSLGSLAMLEGGKITVAFRPETIAYQVPYDRTSNTPTVLYVENDDGRWEPVKQEQTNLLGEDSIENREFLVELDVIDEFIQTAELDYPGDIDPDEVLQSLKDGRSFSDIAADYDMNEEEIEEELSLAREYYAPYAAAWDEKRKREESKK